MAMKVNVTPEYLENLAKNQDDAAKCARDAAAAVSGLKHELYMTHGVISGNSNNAGGAAEDARRAACKAIETAAAGLAAKLRAAKQVYGSVDSELGSNFDKQVRSR